MNLHLFFILIFSSFVCFAQNVEQKTPATNDADWVRIESDSKDFSIGVPAAGFLVDNEEGIYRIYSNKNDVSFTVRMEPRKNFKEEFKNSLALIKDRDKYKFFQSGDFIAMESVDQARDKRFYKWIRLVSSNGIYTVSAFSKDLTDEDYSRFFHSLHLGGKPLYLQKGNFPPEQRSVAISSLKTDEIVLKALRQKDSEQAKLEKATKEEKENIVDNNKYSRPLTILRQPAPGYTEFARRQQIQGGLTLRVEFLANGQIGAIKLVSSLESSLEKKAFQTAKRIKFITAEIDGKPVDVIKIIEYRFSIY